MKESKVPHILGFIHEKGEEMAKDGNKEKKVGKKSETHSDKVNSRNSSSRKSIKKSNTIQSFSITIPRIWR